MGGRFQVSLSTWVRSAASKHKILTQKTGKSSWEMLTVEEALGLLEQGQPPSIEDFVCILQNCRKDRTVENGMRLHAYMREHGLEAHRSLGNYLVPMLVDVGRIQDAQEVFDRLAHRNEYSWNSLLAGYVKCGKSQRALSLYQKMQDDSLHPSGCTFVALLNACAKLQDEKNGRELHTEIIRKGLERDVLVGSTLVNMYAKCGLLAIAQEVFNELAVRDAITWTFLIAGYVKRGHDRQALTCFDQMQLEGMSPNPLTFVCSLKACGCVGMVGKGQVMHAEIARRGLLERDVFVGNAVIDMYAKCGLVAKAQEVFDKLPARDVVSWNALITGFANIGNAEEAFTCFKQMQVEDVSPDAVTLVCNLKACSSAGDVDKGQQLHSEIAIRGFSKGAPLVDNALVDMYASCGWLAEAQEVFDGIELQDTVAWTALIAGYTKHGFGEEALDCYQQMQVKGVTPDVVAYVCGLKACSSIGAIHKGREIQAEIDRLQLLESYVDIGTALVDLYANCGLLAESQSVFDKLPARDVACWNALVSGYATHGSGDEVLKCFEEMQLEGVSPDVNTLICTLKACGSIRDPDKGHEIHSVIVRKMLLEGHHDIGCVLVEMYFGCGSLTEAQNVFDRLPVQDLAPWNALISGFVNHGLYHEASGYFEKMKQQGAVSPDSCTYACSLKACSSIKAEDKCRELHAEIIGKGLLQNYDASGVSPVQSTVLWNAMITAYVNLECGEEALNCSEYMQQDGLSLDGVTCVCSLKACGITGASDKGQRIHADITTKGLWEDDLMVGTALVDMYATCCMLLESQKVFNELVVRDVVAWNALISGHVKQGCDEVALEFLERMKVEGILPNAVTHNCSLNACCNLGALKRGQSIHVHVFEEGLDRDMIGNALVGMYVKFGLLAKAQETFEKVAVRDVSLWNALIAGCSKHDLGEEALDFYERMQREGVTPDAVTFVCSLKACGSVGMLDKGQEMHAVIIKRGLLREEFLIGNGLVDMYAKCGLLAEAGKVFDTLPARDTASWNTLIAGNVNNDCGEGALTLVKQMHLEHVAFDAISFICSLKACGSMGATYNGLELHSEIVRKGLLKWNLVIGNALIDMYVGCGLLAEAQQVLKQLPFRDVVSWTTVIAGFLRHGHDEEALDCLEEMQQEGVPSDVLMWNALIAGYSHLGQAEKICYIFYRMKGVRPDGDSFLSALAACSHTGLVERGHKYFEVMNKEYGIIPTIEHFTCMVDLFGRAGQLDEAIWTIKKMPLQPDIVVWHTLLAACQKWGNVVLGIEAFEFAFKLDEKDAAIFVSMFNIYASADKQEPEMMIDAIE